jgi:hypothetical protein
LILVLCSIVCCAIVGGAAGQPARVRCAFWAAPSGADTNAGTRANPFASLAKLANALAPGQTGCLVPGSTFQTRDVITAVGSRKARATITTGPGGKRAVLLNGVETTQASRYLTLTNLTIDATNGADAGDLVGTVIVRGYSTALTYSDVGPGTLHDGGRSCVVLDHAGSAVIHGNVLHECNGTNARIYGAGVLAANSAGARISNNVIYGNSGGDGIAFSPNAQASVAQGNLLVGNLGGIYFGGDAKTASRGNRIEENVITKSRRFDIHSAYSPGAPVGSGNLVRRNCLWSPGATTAAGTGFTMRANRKVNPRIIKLEQRYALAGTSPCRPKAAAPKGTSVIDILFG